MTRRVEDGQEEKLFFIQRMDKKNTKLVIFVHGWRGDHLSTWGDLAFYLNRHADQKKVLRDWDYLFLGYETHSIRSLVDIAGLIATRWEDAATARAPFGHKYKRLALIGHSLGTLGIRQLLCAASLQRAEMLTALKSVLFFGSPLNGSPLVVAGGAIGRVGDLFRGKPGALLPSAYAINEALKPDGQVLRMLHVWNTSNRIQGLGRKLAIQIRTGSDDHVVYQSELAKWEGDAKPKEYNLDHRQLCKVIYKDANTQAVILTELTGELG